MTRLFIKAVQPFKFHSVVHSHGWYQLPPFLWDADGTLETVLQLFSGLVPVVQLREAEGGVEVTTGEDLVDEDLADLRAQVTWMLDLERDFSGFYELARHEPKLQHVQPKAQGRLLRSPTLFEDMVKTILTTNTSWAGTKRMVAALVGLYGAPVTGRAGQDGSRRAFPTAARLAQTTVRELREDARLGYRAPYIHELAEEVSSGRLDVEGLKNSEMPADALFKHLLKIRGVGGYAAAHLMLLLGCYDRIPVDSWARKLVSEEWYGGEAVGEVQVVSRFESWGSWRALAFWLWNWDYLE